MGVPLAVKASLKLRPCSQGYESRRPHTDRARTPLAQIGGLVLLGATTPKGGGALSCILIPNQAAAKKKKKKKEVRREGVPSAAAISAAGPASVLPPRLVLPSHPLPKKNKNKNKNKIQNPKERERKRRKRKIQENIKNKSKKWGNPKVSKMISRFGAVVVDVGVLFGCGLLPRFFGLVQERVWGV